MNLPIPWMRDPKWKITGRGAKPIYKYNSANQTLAKLKIEMNTTEHFQVLPLKTVLFSIDSEWLKGNADIITYEIDKLIAKKPRTLYQRRKGRELINLDIVFDIFFRYNAYNNVKISGGYFMKLAWVTDVHLNFLEPANRKRFYQDVVATKSNGVLISGDIAEAPTISEILEEIAQHITKPIYFVLGNHDYYQSSVENVRHTVTQLSQANPFVNWLPETGLVQLSQDTLLLGEDCWADGRYGNYTDSRVMLNDSRMIQEFREGSIIGKYQLLDEMQKLAHSDAMRLKKNLQLATQQYSPKKIIILVHVPPFRESCMHEGKISSNDYLPFFASKITGDVLLKAANANLDIDFLVLCGHTHSSSYYKPLNNLTVKAGSVEYGNPIVQEIIKL